MHPGKPATVVGHRLVRKSNMEDARLFRDDRGVIMMLFNRHYPSTSSLRVSLHVTEIRLRGGTIHLAREQVNLSPQIMVLQNQIQR